MKVYYHHGNVRCPTCRTIEGYAQEAVQTGFAAELESGKIEWQVVNCEQSGNEHFPTDSPYSGPVARKRLVAPPEVMLNVKEVFSCMRRRGQLPGECNRT